MNFTVTGSLSHLLHGISPHQFFEGRSTMTRSQQRIEQVMACIDLTRKLRAQCISPNPDPDLQTRYIKQSSKELTHQTQKLCRDRQLAPLSERRVLKQDVEALVFCLPENTLASNLIQHGRIIRGLIYLLDKQIVQFMGQSGKLFLVGDYNEKWMRIMSAIEALTQYRVALSDSGCISLLRVTSRGLVLSNKLREVNEIANIVQYDQTGAIDRLDQANHYHGLKGSEDEIATQLYQLSSQLSAITLEAYTKVIEETCELIWTSDKREWIDA
jgi:hypothetical protein